MATRAYITKSWSPNGGHRLILIKDQEPGKVAIADSFVWREEEEGCNFDPNTGIGRADEIIQKIVDAAWEAGFRPRGFADVKNETAAIREHLADMKAIAFHQLKIAK